MKAIGGCDEADLVMRRRNGAQLFGSATAGALLNRRALEGDLRRERQA